MDTAKAKKPVWFYVLSVIAAGILWGTIGIFIKQLNLYGFTSIEMSAIRAVFSTLFIGVFLAIYKPSLLKIALRDIWMFIGTGLVSLTLFNFCYFTVITKSEVSIAVVLLYTSPIWVMLMSALIFKEKITLSKVAALIMTFAGCVFVAGIIGTPNITIRVFLIGICSGISYATYSIFGSFALKKYSTLTVTFYTFVFASIGSIMMANPVKVVEKISVNPMSLWYICGVAFFCTVLPYVLYTKGLEVLEAGKAAIYVTTEPLTAAVLGISVYHESADLIKILGIVLILSSVVVLSVPKREKKET